MINNTKIAFATLSDLSSWMQLVELVRWNFPGLETKELIDGYRDTVIKTLTEIVQYAQKNVTKLLAFYYSQ